jgi:protein SCO1
VSRALAACLALAVLVALPAPARSALTQAQIADLSFREHPGAPLPLDATLADERGIKVRLGEFFTAGKPVVLVLEYLRCKTLCGFVLGGLADALARLPIEAGKDYAVVAVSIDPLDSAADARAARARYLARYGRANAAGWHFLTGEESAVRRIARAVGFPYRYDAELDQYAHPAGLVVAAPDGTIARYVLGVGYQPRDLRLAIAEAAQGTVSTPLGRLLLLCYGRDVQQGRYTPQIEAAMILANLAGVLAFVAVIAVVHRRRNG